MRSTGHPQTLAGFARVILNLFPYGIVSEAPWRPLSKLGGRDRLHGSPPWTLKSNGTGMAF